MGQNVLKFLAVFFFVLAVYSFFAPRSFQPRHYFVPLANSILHGRFDIESNGDILNELVCRNNKCFVVYPPAPALAAIPFVSIFGSQINQIIPSIIYAALAVAIFYFLTCEFFRQRWIQISLTLLFGFGTNFFYTSLEGTSWFFSHVCVVFFMVLSLLAAVKKKPFLAGALFVGVFLSRLPAALTFPAVLYLLLSGLGGKERLKSAAAFFVSIALGVILFGFYNFARFGSFFQTGYSLIPGVLQEPWFSKGIFSLSYIPRGLECMLLQMPKVSFRFPYFLPSQAGMAIWLTTPALLLLPFGIYKNRATLWLVLASLLALIPSLMHGTPGFSQFGYRFSLDFIVLLILALGYAFRRLKSKIALPFVVLSVAVNLWAVLLFYLGRFGT